MPDGPRERFEPRIHVEPPQPPPEPGFTPRNTSGLDAADLAALNVALARLVDRGLFEHDANMTLHVAVADWLDPKEAAEEDHLIFGRAKSRLGPNDLVRLRGP